MADNLVQVVRCRDCDHYKQVVRFGTEVSECEELEICTGPDDYCSFGRRKEDHEKQGRVD